MRKNRKTYKKVIYGILGAEIVIVLVLACVLALRNDFPQEKKTPEEINGIAEKIEKPSVQGERIVPQAAPEEKEPIEDQTADGEYGYEKRISRFEPKAQGEVELAFAGDILFDDEYSIMVRIIQRGKGIQGSVSEPLLSEMRGADIFMLNNEFTYTKRGEPIADKQFTFRADPDTAGYLEEMGVDIVSLANNHAYDYGEISLLDSLDTLEQIEMPYVGAGRNLEEASAPYYFQNDGIKIGIVSATQIERLDNPDTKGAAENSAGVFRCWDGALLYETVEEAAGECDFLIAYIHWGSENTDVLDAAQKDQARKLALAGADLIIGDHPHCLQEIGTAEGVPVIYSLGNFLFNSKTVDTCLVKVTITRDGIKSLRFIPALQSDCSVKMLEGGEKKRVLDYMRSISKDVTIDDEGFVTY